METRENMMFPAFLPTTPVRFQFLKTQNHVISRSTSAPTTTTTPLSTSTSTQRKSIVRMVAAEPSSASGTRVWTPDSWRQMPIKQLPEYPDKSALEAMENKLGRALPLVFSGECEHLKEQLARAARGDAFVLQGGDCAESFEEFDRYGGKNVADTFTLVIQMSIVLMYSLRKPVVKILRSAGQFAKPRSSPFERKKNQELSLPSYRGDIINGPGFTKEDRTPDPARMEKAFIQSTATINLLRTLASGGALDLHDVHDINLEFIRDTKQGQKFAEYACNIDNAIAFMESIGLQSDSYRVKQAEFSVSHESLLLPYEQALTRQDPQTGKYYATSGHFLWLGDRTRQPDGGHVEFMRGISNPIGIKCGPTLEIPDLMKLLDILNPNNEEGRITLITRVGAGKVREHLPRFIEAVRREGRNVVWSCDPCHGNTEATEQGYKTRQFENILQEVKEFFAVHQSMGTYPGGVHLELTGQDVTECVGGMMDVTAADLQKRYETQCDPRLNASQALELAFLLAENQQVRCLI